MNFQAVRSIYMFEMARAGRTVMQSVISPVISTALYFIVFGSAIGSRMQSVDGIDYGSFIVPGLIMLTLLTQSISNASFGIYFPRFVGTIYELLSAPVSAFEAVLAYVGAAATKSIILGLIILATSFFFVDLRIEHPFAMLLFLVLTALSFSLFGFIIGIWADGFEKLQIIPLLIITPLTFLGGSFYSITMLPPFWQKVSLFNPVVYLVSGFRWSFYGQSDVPIAGALQQSACSSPSASPSSRGSSGLGTGSRTRQVLVKQPQPVIAEVELAARIDGGNTKHAALDRFIGIRINALLHPGTDCRCLDSLSIQPAGLAPLGKQIEIRDVALLRPVLARDKLHECFGLALVGSKKCSPQRT